LVLKTYQRRRGRWVFETLFYLPTGSQESFTPIRLISSVEFAMTSTKDP